jgi:preprotein translocase subunit YajC
MWMLMMEAGVALLLLVFFVWWTMFAGRKPDRPQQRQRQDKDKKKNDTPAS